MKMLKIAALSNGAHRNQTCHGPLPEGWALIPEGMELPNFPFGEVVAEKVDGVMTVTKWVPGIVPESGTATPTQQREEAYNTQPIIPWEGEPLTVSQAAQKWMYYAAEDSEKAAELTALIADAKQAIRAQYPDEEVVT